MVLGFVARVPGLGVLVSVDRTVDPAGKGGNNDTGKEVRVDGHGTLVVSEGPRNEIKPKQRGERERESEKERERGGGKRSATTTATTAA